MNEFKKRLEIIEKLNTKPNTNRKKEIDEKIGNSIAKLLFDMMQSSDDKIERKQILDRMLSINNLFKNEFDEEMEILKSAKEKEEGLDKDDTK